MEKYNLEEKLPYILKCGHPVCKVCMKGMCNDKKIRCHKCRKVNEYKSESEFTKSYFIINLLSSL